MDTLTCSHCGKELITYDEVGYDGPRDRDTPFECSPFVPWMVLCHDCENKEHEGA